MNYKKKYLKYKTKYLSLKEMSGGSNDNIVNKVNNFINELKKKNIQLLVFDFDKTILNINAYELYKNDYGFDLYGIEFKKHMNTRNDTDIEKEFADLELFKEIISQAKNNDIKIGIASNNFDHIIRVYLEKVKINDIPIGINDTLKYRDTKYYKYDDNQNKNSKIDNLIGRINDNNLFKDTTRENVLLIDDDIKNFNDANGYYVFTSNIKTGFNIDELNKLISELPTMNLRVSSTNKLPTINLRDPFFTKKLPNINLDNKLITRRKKQMEERKKQIEESR
jgi:hypothetical protein